MKEKLELATAHTVCAPNNMQVWSRSRCEAGLDLSCEHGVKRLGVSLDDANDPGSPSTMIVGNCE